MLAWSKWLEALGLWILTLTYADLEFNSHTKKDVNLHLVHTG